MYSVRSGPIKSLNSSDLKFQKNSLGLKSPKTKGGCVVLVVQTLEFSIFMLVYTFFELKRWGWYFEGHKLLDQKNV